mmetsp:Transcript_55098/g.98312  ORF Transcript_55098/g.98312 Transcript_55098/m.98312 type:complete len:233 (-) Transcript_55098:1806-2504(-)
MTILNSKGPVVGIGLDHGIICKDDFHIHVEEPSLTKSLRQQLSSGLGLLLGHIFSQGENTNVTAPPCSMLSQQPRQENQETSIVNHPPNINGACGFRGNVSREAFPRKHGFLSRVGVAQNLHKVPASRDILLIWPLQHDGIGNETTNASELDNVVCPFCHGGCNHDLSEALDGLLLHDVSDHLLLCSCLRQGFLIPLLGLQDARHHTEATAFPEMRGESKNSFMALHLRPRL